MGCAHLVFYVSLFSLKENREQRAEPLDGMELSKTKRPMDQRVDPALNYCINIFLQTDVFGRFNEQHLCLQL